MYTFARVRLNYINGKKIQIDYPWMLVLDSIEALNNYMDTYQKKEITDGIQEVMKKPYKHHNITRWGAAVEQLMEIRGESCLVASTRLENDIYKSRIKMILNYGRMYINQVGGGFPHLDGYEILEEIETNSIIWPEYSEKDISITKWKNGNHYYARIGNMEVIIDGKQKWNTAKEAKRNALKYLQQIESNT